MFCLVTNSIGLCPRSFHSPSPYKPTTSLFPSNFFLTQALKSDIIILKNTFAFVVISFPRLHILTLFPHCHTHLFEHKPVGCLRHIVLDIFNITMLLCLIYFQNFFCCFLMLYLLGNHHFVFLILFLCEIQYDPMVISLYLLPFVLP